MNNYAIIVIAYNRARETERLLKSINQADFEGENLPLIISIDNSGNDSVYEMAQAFEWQHGEKIIRRIQDRMGLRNHILSCGDYLEKYDAVAVLEDDIFVAPDFYRYMKQAVNFYGDDDRIAGISLYSHLWNVNVSYPFVPEESNADTYFIQYAASWGQIWMKRQWFAFKEWYEQNKEEFGYREGIPGCVCRWKNSWLKYHIRYCIEHDKYFVYPYRSLTTCFAEQGEHAFFKTTTFQVPLFRGKVPQYSFARLEKDAVIYDAFFERKSIGNIGNVREEQLCVDLYGKKGEQLHKKYDYVLSTEELPYQIVKSYALDLRPWELNAVLGIEGNDIFLYHTGSPAKEMSKKLHKEQQLKVWHYFARAFVKKKIIIRAFLDYYSRKIRNNIKR